MSVNFWTPNAPQRVEHFDCLCVDFVTEVADPECPYCRGSGKTACEQRQGEFNMSNANSRALLSLLNLDPVEGELEVSDIPLVRRLIVRLRGSPRRRSAALSESIQETGVMCANQGGATLIIPGRSDDYVLRRLEDFDRLLQIAQETNGPVFWG